MPKSPNAYVALDFSLHHPLAVQCPIDHPKGDLANLLLTFKDITAANFLPWVEAQVAATQGLSPEDYAQTQAELQQELNLLEAKFRMQLDVEELAIAAKYTDITQPIDGLL